MQTNRATTAANISALHSDMRDNSPLAQLGLAILALVSFRIFLTLNLTTGGYATLVSELADGGLMQQFAARVLALDEISQMLVQGLRLFIG